MSKKTFVAAIIILAFSISLVVGMQVVKADSNASMTFSGGVTIYCPLNETYDSNYLTLNLTAMVAAGVQTSFNYSIDEVSQGPILLVYSYGGLPIYYENGIVALPELSAGSHALTIYEQCILPDYHGANPPGAPFKQISPNSLDWIASYVDNVYFFINSSWTPPPSPSTPPSPFPTPSLTSSPNPLMAPTPSLNLSPSFSPSQNLTPSLSPNQQPTLEPAQTTSPTTEPNNSTDSLPIITGIVIVVMIAVAGALVYFKKRGAKRE